MYRLWWHLIGDCEKAPLRLKFNPKIQLEFRGAAITSDAAIFFKGPGHRALTKVCGPGRQVLVVGEASKQGQRAGTAHNQ